MQVVKQLLDLREQKAALEAQLKEINAAIETAEAEVQEYFLQNEISKVSAEGKTVYLARSPWVKLIDQSTLTLDTLRRNGLEWLIKPTVNTSSLSSWYREQQQTDTAIPAQVKAILAVTDNFEVRVKKS